MHLGLQIIDYIALFPYIMAAYLCILIITYEESLGEKVLFYSVTVNY